MNILIKNVSPHTIQYNSSAFNLLNNSRVSEFLDMLRLNLFLWTKYHISALILLGWLHKMLFYPCFYNLYAF